MNTSVISHCTCNHGPFKLPNGQKVYTGLCICGRGGHGCWEHHGNPTKPNVHVGPIVTSTAAPIVTGTVVDPVAGKQPLIGKDVWYNHAPKGGSPPFI